MSDEQTEERTDTEATRTEEPERESDVVLDAEAATEYETRIKELQATVEDQNDRIEELEDLLLDLSTRVADGRDMGVCPDCHGPVVKIRRFLRSNSIKCQRCDRVFYRE